MEIFVQVKTINLKASIIKQFKRIDYTEIDGAECLGYVINIIKDTYKTYIIRLGNGEYRMLEYSWYGYNTSNKIYKRCKNGTAQIQLDTIDNARDFIAFLKECGETSQIYI